GKAGSARTLESLAAILPPVLERALSRHVSFAGHFDVMMTNVPGTEGSLTFMDAPLCRILPIAPPTTGHALHATIISYSGTLTLGFSADRDAVPDLEVVRAGAQRTLRDLELLAPRCVRAR
ncbi:MAG TPA: WS/DGAT domain-containing protein, partial [Opitutaceae bacterium]|nr:WS/DGAT domain-containing protein [Opitutaceae bacterium]